MKIGRLPIAIAALVVTCSLVVIGVLILRHIPPRKNPIDLVTLQKLLGPFSSIVHHMEDQSDSKYETILWNATNMDISATEKNGIIVRFAAHGVQAPGGGILLVDTDRILQNLCDGKTWQKQDDTGYVRLRSDGKLYALVSDYSGVSVLVPSEFKLSNKKLPFLFDTTGDLTVSGVFKFDQHLNANPAGNTHPAGRIKKLVVQGVSVDLVSEQINDGQLTTKEFGDLEVFRTSAGWEFHGTDAQRKTIQKYLDDHGRHE